MLLTPLPAGQAIPCGGTLVAGDEGLEFNTTSVPGQFVLEVLCLMPCARTGRSIPPHPFRLVCLHVAG